MSDLTYGIHDDEVRYPNPRRHQPPRHMASGSGWELPGERGGGKVPDRNPWRDDRPYDNPAQDGLGLLPVRGQRK